jgi:hypothetical protein
MRGNSHVRFGAGDEETCLGNGVRRFIPTLPKFPRGPLPLARRRSGRRLKGRGRRHAASGGVAGSEAGSQSRKASR